MKFIVQFCSRTVKDGEMVFLDLIDMELLNTDDAIVLGYIYCCYMEIIREELNSVKEDSNNNIFYDVTTAVPRGAQLYASLATFLW